jgi:hypothetical protein
MSPRKSGIIVRPVIKAKKLFSVGESPVVIAKVAIGVETYGVVKGTLPGFGDIRTAR